METKHSQTHNYRAQIKQSSENQFIWPPFEAFDFLEEEKQLFPRPAKPVYIVYMQRYHFYLILSHSSAIKGNS